MVLGFLLGLEYEKGARKGKLGHLQDHGAPREAQIPGVGMLPWCQSHPGGCCGTPAVTAWEPGPCRWLAHLLVRRTRCWLRHKPR